MLQHVANILALAIGSKAKINQKQVFERHTDVIDVCKLSSTWDVRLC